MKKIILALFTLATVSANAQFIQRPEITAITVPSTVAASTLVATNCTAVQVSRNQGIAVTASLTATNVNASTVTFYFAASYDGTNYTTTNNVLNMTVPITVNPASSPQIYSTNFTADVLNNVQKIRLIGINNGVTNTLTINSLNYSVFR